METPVALLLALCHALHDVLRHRRAGGVVLHPSCQLPAGCQMSASGTAWGATVVCVLSVRRLCRRGETVALASTLVLAGIRFSARRTTCRHAGANGEACGGVSSRAGAVMVGILGWT